MRRIPSAGGAAGPLVVAMSLMCLSLAGCGGQGGGPGPAGRSATVTPGADAAVVVAAGDIATHPRDGIATADLIRGIAPDAVLALGNNVFGKGGRADYDASYEPTWGVFRSTTRPVPGPQEYRTPGAAGYFEYFADQVHGQEYYAWDAGAWRMYALNCEIECGHDSPQGRWLTQDLRRNAGRPVLAYLHQPLFTCSPGHRPAARVDNIWRTLQAGGGQILLAGNNRAYERFSHLDADGHHSYDGLREFVVGTGGAPLQPLAPDCPHRRAQNSTTHGVLELTLGTRAYSWKFLGTDGTVVDAGVGLVHRRSR